MKRTFVYFLVCGFLASCSIFKPNLDPFGITYTKLTAEQAQGYKLLIVNPDHYSREEVWKIKTNGLKLIAQFDPLKISANNLHFESLRAFCHRANNAATDTYYLNINNPQAQEILLKNVIGSILNKGFDGIFITSFNEISLGGDCCYLKEDMLNLMRNIKRTYRNTLIIQEGGTFLLDTSAGYIDGIVICDVASYYDNQRKESRFKDNLSFEKRARNITGLSQKYDLPLYIVDYAYSNLLQKKIRDRLELINYPYFITTSEFDQLPARSY